MANNETDIPRAVTPSGVEDHKRLFPRGRHLTHTASHTSQIESIAEQPAQEPNNMNNEALDNFHAVATRVVTGEHPGLPAAAHVTTVTSVQILIRDALAGIPVHVEQVSMKMVIDSNVNPSVTDSNLSALLGRLVLQIFHRMLRTSATLKTNTDAMLDHPGSIVLLAASVTLERKRLTTEQAKNAAQWRQFVDLGAKSNRAMPIQISERGEEPPSDVLYDNKTNLWDNAWSTS